MSSAGQGLAADLDLDKLACIQGGNIHVQLTLFGLEDDIPQFITGSGGFMTAIFATIPIGRLLGTSTKPFQ